ncbi:sulfotransferase family protein [Rhodovulum bhavnagarense]|uniref:Sulfotransferase family protein n=1 Tax=Rhodovulum bhavnagarense TaxID=992286 RepID=A0A4V2SWD3_9RHOB|nr:sulfotransferase family 2 domain-containing protein [Rhodovulum bhavnagarense]TCP61696.1 sulfotransferase family protein [Rhodovulum bhavnagarense]
MGWRGYIDAPHGVVFFWSQKAACTTLFGFLADNMDPRPTRKQHFHLESKGSRKCLEAIEAEGHRAVILARHPVTRCISAYFNKFCQYRGKSLRHRDDLEPFARDLHDHFCAMRGHKTDDNILTFEDFLDTVADLHATRPKPHLPINGHWDTQVPAHLVQAGFAYDEVIRVETLDRDMPALAERLCMRWTPRTMNRTRVAETPTKGYLGTLPAREVAAYPFGYANFITPDTLARIGEIYEVDFTMFGYQPTP